jgi:transcriptional regulator with XRE-family HTH domain
MVLIPDAPNIGSADPEERAGKALRQLRLARGWSQEEVAMRMRAYGYDFHQTAIAKVEAAQRPLRVRELADFAALYGVQVQDLVYGPARSPAETREEAGEVNRQLERARAAGAAAAANLQAARDAVYAAESAYQAAAAEIAKLEGRLAALTADQQKPGPPPRPAKAPARPGGEDAQRDTLAAQHAPAVLRIALGNHFRLLREAAGVSREDAAQAIRVSSATLGMLESGQIAIKQRDASGLLVLYGAPGEPERGQLIELARKASSPDWSQADLDPFPGWVDAHIELETGAAEVRIYEALFVPDVLQTEEYARSLTLLDKGDLAPEAAERMIALRSAREGMFLRKKDPSRLLVVLDETVLRREVGGPEVMREQLMHINDVGELPNVTIQVAPLTGSSHAPNKSFRILEYSEGTLPDIVLLEQLTNPLYLEDAGQVDRYRKVMSQLMSQALTAGESTSFIQEILAEAGPSGV